MFQSDFSDSKAIPARKALNKAERAELRRLTAMRKIWARHDNDGRAL